MYYISVIKEFWFILRNVIAVQDIGVRKLLSWCLWQAPFFRQGKLLALCQYVLSPFNTLADGTSCNTVFKGNIFHSSIVMVIWKHNYKPVKGQISLTDVRLLNIQFCMFHSKVLAFCQKYFFDTKNFLIVFFFKFFILSILFIIFFTSIIIPWYCSLEKVAEQVY